MPAAFVGYRRLIALFLLLRHVSGYLQFEHCERGICPEKFACGIGNICYPLLMHDELYKDGETECPVDHTYSGRCMISAECAANGRCINGGCCTKEIVNLEKCPSGLVAEGPCLEGKCPAGAICKDGLCCFAQFEAIEPLRCRNASHTIEQVMEGVAKNCMVEPCKRGFRCEYNADGEQYICCGHPWPMQGNVMFYHNTLRPIRCFQHSDCSHFFGYPYCSPSAKHGHHVCCSTFACA